MLLALAPFLANADAGIVALALPDLQRDLAMTMTGVHWVTNVYVLLLGGLQIPGGKLVDIVGARRLFLGSLVGFALAAAACGAAPSGSMLITARAVQAVAAAVLVPAAMAMVMTTVTTPAERARSLTLWATIGGAGSVSGVLLGGLVVDHLDWRWAFYLNLPVIAIALSAAPRLLPADCATRAGGIDLPGTLTLIAGLFTFVHTLVNIPERGWNQTTYLGSAATLLLGALFLATQARSRHPLFPMAVMRDRGLVAGVLGVLFVSAATAPVVFIGSLYLQRTLAFSPQETGLALLPMVGAVLLLGRTCRRLLTRYGPRPPYLVGCALIAAGLLLLSGIAPGTGYLTDLLPGIVLTGAGLPFIWITCEATALASILRKSMGIAAGIVQSAGQIGAAMGLAVAVTICTAHGAHPALADAMPPIFVTAATLMIPALVNSLRGFRRR
ncbi:MFS transporter [Nonomuraea sp. NPDC002799]